MSKNQGGTQGQADAAVAAMSPAAVLALLADDAAIRAAGQGSKLYYAAVEQWQMDVMRQREALLTALSAHVGLPAPTFGAQGMTTPAAREA